jgi:hypothetical protein
VTTPRTSTAGVSGIDQFKANTFSSCFVLHKELPLGVGPSVNFGPEVLPFTQRTVSNIAEVFADDPLRSVVNRIPDQFLARLMEEMHRYGCLISRHPAEQAAGGFGANGLDGGAGAPDARTAVIELSAFEEKCFMIAGISSSHEAFDAKVHPHYTPCSFRFSDIHFVSKNQMPLPSDPFYPGVLPSGFRNPGPKQLNGFAEDGHTLFIAGEVPPPSNRYSRLPINCQLPTFVGLGRLIGGSDLSEKGTGQLRRYLEFFPDDAVELLMELPRVQFFGPIDDRGQPIQSSEVTGRQSIVMLYTALKPYLDCTNCLQYKQSNHILLNMSTTKTHNQTDAIPPTALAVGFLAKLL